MWVEADKGKNMVKALKRGIMRWLVIHHGHNDD